MVKLKYIEARATNQNCINKVKVKSILKKSNFIRGGFYEVSQPNGRIYYEGCLTTEC
jgi:hypothetical protein